MLASDRNHYATQCSTRFQPNASAVYHICGCNRHSSSKGVLTDSTVKCPIWTVELARSMTYLGNRKGADGFVGLYLVVFSEARFRRSRAILNIVFVLKSFNLVTPPVKPHSSFFIL